MFRVSISTSGIYRADCNITSTSTLKVKERKTRQLEFILLCPRGMAVPYLLGLWHYATWVPLALELTFSEKIFYAMFPITPNECSFLY